MMRGEEAILVCTPKLAYGRRGRPPHVPPSATLAFSIHLLDWHQWEDLTGDLGVLKTVLEAGTGSSTPGEADVCQGVEYCLCILCIAMQQTFGSWGFLWQQTPGSANIIESPIRMGMLTLNYEGKCSPRTSEHCSRITESSLSLWQHLCMMHADECIT